MEKSMDQDNENVYACATGINTCRRCGESLPSTTQLILHQQRHRISDRKSGNPGTSGPRPRKSENPDTSTSGPRPRRSARAKAQIETVSTNVKKTVTKTTTPPLVDITGDDDVETPLKTSVFMLSEDTLIRAIGNVQVNFV